MARNGSLNVEPNRSLLNAHKREQDTLCHRLALLNKPSSEKDISIHDKFKSPVRRDVRDNSAMVTTKSKFIGSARGVEWTHSDKRAIMASTVEGRIREAKNCMRQLESLIENKELNSANDHSVRVKLQCLLVYLRRDADAVSEKLTDGFREDLMTLIDALGKILDAHEKLVSNMEDNSTELTSAKNIEQSSMLHRLESLDKSTSSEFSNISRIESAENGLSTIIPDQYSWEQEKVLKDGKSVLPMMRYKELSGFCISESSENQTPSDLCQSNITGRVRRGVPQDYFENNWDVIVKYKRRLSKMKSVIKTQQEQLNEMEKAAAIHQMRTYFKFSERVEVLETELAKKELALLKCNELLRLNGIVVEPNAANKKIGDLDNVGPVRQLLASSGTLHVRSGDCWSNSILSEIDIVFKIDVEAATLTLIMFVESITGITDLHLQFTTPCGLSVGNEEIIPSSTSVLRNQQVTRSVNLKCRSPFQGLARMKVDYSSNGGRYVGTTTLPISILRFLRSIQLTYKKLKLILSSSIRYSMNEVSETLGFRGNWRRVMSCLEDGGFMNFIPEGEVFVGMLSCEMYCECDPLIVVQVGRTTGPMKITVQSPEREISECICDGVAYLFAS